jgi:pyrroline-5-carboxylate reductase
MSKLLMVGCGNLGSAVLSGIIENSCFTKDDISVIVPKDKVRIISKNYGVSAIWELDALDGFDVLIFMVKPQIIGDIIEEYASYVKDKNLKKAIIISPIAGKKVSYYKQFFPNNLIIRTMPNTNAKLKRSITGAIASREMNSGEAKLVNSILNSIGKVVWLDNEAKMDAVNAISGSGPAYFYQFAEELVKAAKGFGFSPEVAEDLVKETLIGSALALEEKGDISALKNAVISPNGTTFAALNAFAENDALQHLVEKATKAAYNRAVELSK